MNSIDLVKKWLIDSGIQNIGTVKETNGGFNGYFDIKKKDYPFVYSEITGYGITTLLYMWEMEKKKALIDKAKLAVDWLMTNAYDKCGGFKTRYFRLENGIYSFQNSIVHTFDAGIILYSIVSLFNDTKEQKYLDIAKNVANFLLNGQKKDGLFNAMYDAENEKYVDTNDKWSTQSGSYHAKLALGMIELFNVTKNNSYMNSVKKMCDSALKFQKNDGRFSTFGTSGGTHLHPHSYSAEGLLFAGIKLNEKKYIKSAVRACEWALNNQLDNGGIPFLFSNEGKFVQYERTDILSQVMRLGCMLISLGELDRKYADNLLRLRERLIQFQLTNEKGINEKGGFLFGFDFDGTKKDHVNSWCSMFAYQALQMYEKSLRNGKVSVDLLV